MKLEIITLLFTGISSIAAVAVAYIAFKQLNLLRLSQQKWSTLQACDRYDLDPVLATVIQRIKSWEKGKGDQEKYDPEADAIVLLNYFDAIAIGILQGFYSRPIVNDHLFDIIDGWVGAMSKWDKATLSEADLKNYHPKLYEYLQSEKSGRSKLQGRV